MVIDIVLPAVLCLILIREAGVVTYRVKCKTERNFARSENCVPAATCQSMVRLKLFYRKVREVPVTNLKGLVTLPPSSSGSGIGSSGIVTVFAMQETRRS